MNILPSEVYMSQGIIQNFSKKDQKIPKKRHPIFSKLKFFLVIYMRVFQKNKIFEKFQFFTKIFDKTADCKKIANSLLLQQPFFLWTLGQYWLWGIWLSLDFITLSTTVHQHTRPWHFFFVGVSHRVINNWHNSGDIKPIQIERNVGIISDTSGFILIFIFIIIAKSPDDDDWRGCICFSQEIINNLESINSLSRMRIS